MTIVLITIMTNSIDNNKDNADNNNYNHNNNNNYYYYNDNYNNNHNNNKTIIFTYHKIMRSDVLCFSILIFRVQLLI